MKKLKKANRPNLYDYLKIIALITMLIDHIGYYLFPEYDFLRVIGRVAFPIFLFLVGFSGSYSRRRDIPIIGIILWIFSSYISNKYGYGDTSANILIGITITRFILNYINKRFWYRIIYISIFFVLIHPILKNYIDYGSLSIIFGLRGRIAKYHKKYFPIGIITLIWLIIYNIGIFDFGFKKGNLNYFFVLCFLYFIIYLLTFILTSENKTIVTNNKGLDTFILYFSTHALDFYWIHIIILTILGLFKFGFI